MEGVDVGGGSKTAVEGMGDFEGVAELGAVQVSEGDTVDEEFGALKANFNSQYLPKVRVKNSLWL